MNRIKKSGFSAFQPISPNLTMSAGKAGWTAFYITLKQNILFYLYTVGMTISAPLSVAVQNQISI